MFVEVADTRVDHYDMVEFLRALTARAAEVVDVPAVDLLLTDAHGRLQLMAASDEQTRVLELFQLQNHEGPAWTPSAPASPSSIPTCARPPPDGRSSPLHATQLGFRSVHALPMRLRSRIIGALNLFGIDAGSLDPGDVAVVQALADIATIGLLQEQAIHRAEIHTEQLQGALTSRVVIEQAKGALARTHDIDVDAAFTLLRTYALNHNRKLVDLARTVLTARRASPR